VIAAGDGGGASSSSGGASRGASGAGSTGGLRTCIETRAGIRAVCEPLATGGGAYSRRRPGEGTPNGGGPGLPMAIKWSMKSQLFQNVAKTPTDGRLHKKRGGQRVFLQ
jgi:hypothetical protein